MAEWNVTAENFDETVNHSAQPVLLDFWASWCGPCRMLTPVLAEFAEEHEATLRVGKVNVDEENELAERFGIMSIPTLVLLKNGEEVSRHIGYCTKEQLAELIG